MAVSPRVPVRFRWSGPPGQQVELAGDFPAWNDRRALVEGPPGQYALELELEPGLYRYKFVLNSREWVSDPAAQAVDEAEGHHNGVCAVGGSAAPLAFAPDRR